jgi:hypothetical protein
LRRGQFKDETETLEKLEKKLEMRKREHTAQQSLLKKKAGKTNTHADGAPEPRGKRQEHNASRASEDDLQMIYDIDGALSKVNQKAATRQQQMSQEAKLAKA